MAIVADVVPVIAPDGNGHRVAGTAREEERELIAAAYQTWLPGALARQQWSEGPNRGGYLEFEHGWCDGRQAAYFLARLTAVRCWEEWIEFDVEELERAMEGALEFVCARQNAGGELDLGGSYSANEAGFPVAGLCAAYRRLRRWPDGRFAGFCERLKGFLLRSGEALLHGDAFTSNHRWAAVGAGLASLHREWPDERYLRKAESLISEGIDCDSHGCWYEERSTVYNNVANRGLMVIARCLNRPDLLDHIRRNLEFILRFLQPNGEMDASFSFRQDRGAPGMLPCNYAVARMAALRWHDGRYVWLADQARLRGGILNDDLMPLPFDFEEYPGDLPPAEAPSAKVDFHHPGINLWRRRRNQTALTLAADAGGHFFDTVLDQWGGVKRSEDWFHFMHGDVGVQTVRLAGASMKHIQPNHLKVKDGVVILEGSDPGWEHTLHFSPGRRRVRMPWRGHHHIEVDWREAQRQMALRIHAEAPKALVATLWIWVRAGITVREGTREWKFSPGEIHDLRGGETVHLEGTQASVSLKGLPLACHRMRLQPSESVPTKIREHCFGLACGLSFPVHLNLRWSWTGD